MMLFRHQLKTYLNVLYSRACKEKMHPRFQLLSDCYSISNLSTKNTADSITVYIMATTSTTACDPSDQSFEKSISSTNNDQASFSATMYNDRAASYDTSNGGWHIQLGKDFAHWVKPQPGMKVLDLACGTGLVSIPMAEMVGKQGAVIAIDVATDMLNLARQKPLSAGSATIGWVEHDINDLSGVGVVQVLLRESGGFDIISCCSALVLLGRPADAIAHWASLLKCGGRMIIDVPTEDKTLQVLLTSTLRERVGMPLPFDSSWIKGVHSLGKVYEAAGLIAERTWRSENYLPVTVTEEKDMEKVFEEQMRSFRKSFEREGKLVEAKRVWPDVWREACDEKGRVKDGYWVYVGIARKP